MEKYAPNALGVCLFCGVKVKFLPGQSEINSFLHAADATKLFISVCPECGKLTYSAQFAPKSRENSKQPREDQFAEEIVMWPLQGMRQAPKDVPSEIASDYEEATAVLNISPKASAALSRRCLQAVLRDAGGANQHNLVDQIKAVKDSLPGYIAESIDAIRLIGNFAAHPIKETDSGQIVNVEPGEAEWNLEVIELLFDFYYVRPASVGQMQRDLNDKLVSAGKKAVDWNKTNTERSSK